MKSRYHLEKICVDEMIFIKCMLKYTVCGCGSSHMVQAGSHGDGYRTSGHIKVYEFIE
jgi:hypothetical protein